MRILREAGFSQTERQKLIKDGVVGFVEDTIVSNAQLIIDSLIEEFRAAGMGSIELETMKNGTVQTLVKKMREIGVSEKQIRELENSLVLDIQK